MRREGPHKRRNEWLRYAWQVSPLALWPVAMDRSLHFAGPLRNQIANPSCNRPTLSENSFERGKQFINRNETADLASPALTVWPCASYFRDCQVAASDIALTPWCGIAVVPNDAASFQRHA